MIYIHQKMQLKKRKNLAAEAFGADHTFFSVQGTSGAIMAMIMSVVGPGDKIIVPRNVHKSINVCYRFAGAIPIFIHPEVDSEYGIAHGISAESVEKALIKLSRCKSNTCHQSNVFWLCC